MSDVSDGFGNTNQNHMIEYHILPIRRPTTKDLKWKSQLLRDNERLGAWSTQMGIFGDTGTGGGGI